MKKIESKIKVFALIFITVFTHLTLQSQSIEDFETILKIKTTPFKDQKGTGTCWSFATTSFIETEAIRLGKDPIILSPIYYVRPTYLAKSKIFIENRGDSYYGPGDLTFSVLDAYEKFGAIPEAVYDGIIEGDWQHDHGEMNNLLHAMVKSIGNPEYGRIKPYSWSKAIEGVLSAYLGVPPASFVYKGKVYAPQSFAKEHIGIKPDNYIEITSYTQSDFYKMFVLDIPANWNKGKYLNVPIKDFERIVDHALDNGYSLAWDGDASEPLFDYEKGISKLSNKEEDTIITQELRQQTFEDESTTDDHNMHLIGKAKNKAGKTYYILKNSEGKNNMNGYIYMSKNALLLKTISLLIHKDGIPSDIKQKSNLK